MKDINSNDSIKTKEKKKINWYSLKIKIIIVILICISSSIAYINYHITLHTRSVYEGHDIEEEFARYSHMVVDTKLNLQNENHIKEVYEKKYLYYKENNINLPADMEDIENKINERIQDLNNSTSYLNRIVNFVYLIIDNKTGSIIYTNIENNPNITVKHNNQTNQNEYQYQNILVNNPIEILRVQPKYMSVINGITNSKLNYNNYDHVYSMQRLIKEINIQNEVSLHFAIIEPVGVSSIDNYEDVFFHLYQNYYSVSNIYVKLKYTSMISFVLMIVLIIFMTLLAGRNEKYGEVKLQWIDKIPIDIHILVILFIYLFIFERMYNLNEVTEFILISIQTLIILNCLCSVARCFKSKTLIKTSLIYYCLVKLKIFILNLKHGFKSSYKKEIIIFLFLIIFLIILNGLCFLYQLIYGIECIILLPTLALDFIFIMWGIDCFISLKKVTQATKEISEGNIEYYIDFSSFPKDMQILSKNIIRMQNGLSEAVKRAVQDEHLKTELITNVSHDLKTPLTSIINYIGLIKQEDLNSKKAYEYLDILDEKSDRLKQLIEDLIEVSKASSGNISVTVEKLDLHQLIMQSYGEYENKLSKNNLDVHIESLENQILVCADGKHMWRIISNLLSNVSKYALPNSRVYIDLFKEDNYAILSIKNISNCQLNISPEHLTERFVRGDSSRTTDGSGLGLSIAQNLTQLQGGKFEIFIDGDLFKVNIKIPLWVN